MLTTLSSRSDLRHPDVNDGRLFQTAFDQALPHVIEYNFQVSFGCPCMVQLDSGHVRA